MQHLLAGPAGGLLPSGQTGREGTSVLDGLFVDPDREVGQPWPLELHPGSGMTTQDVDTGQDEVDLGRSEPTRLLREQGAIHGHDLRDVGARLGTFGSATEQSRGPP